MENVKIGFFKRAKRAIFNFDEYANFITENINVSIKYFLKLIFVFSILVAILLTYEVYHIGTDGLMEIITQNISEEDINIDDLYNTIQQMEGSPLYIGIFAITVFAVVYIIYALSILLNVLVASILGLIINALLGTKFKYTDIFKIAVYSITLPVVLLTIYQIVNLLFGFYIKYFDTAYDAISYIYLITAMMTIKSEMIKNMQEVQKVVEIEKQVKDELKEEREEKEREKSDNEKKKEEDKKEESDEPQGDNA